MPLQRSLARLVIHPVVYSRCIATSAPILAERKRKDPTLPNVPRGPASSYTLFVQDWFKREKDNYVSPDTGKISIASVSQAMGDAWRALESSAKEQYERQAKDLKKTYDSTYRTWYEELSPETIKAIEKTTGKKLSPPGGRANYKKEQAARPGNPGKPTSAFFEFLADLRQKQPGEKGLAAAREVVRQGAQQWREMSESEKQHWKDVSAEKKRKYDEWSQSL